jgi:acyl-CoA synthetase (AMP-forming)/AMP-acid ligase II
VGLPIGTDVAILDDDGNELPAGEPGEVAVRGPTVMAGYENDPDANARSFCGGWFRTGDMGYVDAAGYLLLTGRIREVINRGGEKISPAEIDAVLESHPAVVEAAAFGLAHPTLNELVVAAVVAARDRNVSERELRQHARSRLGPSKVPAKIYFVDSLPRNKNGKLQRNKLAAQIERKRAQQPAPA